MTQQELQENQIRLKAKLKQLKLSVARGLAKATELREIEDALLKLNNHVPDGKPIDSTQPKKDERPWAPEPQSLSKETIAILFSLKEDLSAIDLRKALLCNSLAAIPANVPARELVDQIMGLRQQWTEKKDQIDYVQAHGSLPARSAPVATATDEVAGWQQKLPSDRLAINQVLLNERSNLSKYKGRRAKAETLAKRQHYEVQIAKAERKIAILDSLLNA